MKGLIKMRFLLALVLIMALALPGCGSPAPQLMVKLSTPSDGSVVSTLSPMLLWGSGGGAAVFRLLVAADSNFQNLIIDASNLGEPRYSIPSGRLNNNTNYYWKVIASKGNTTSEWSAQWSFQTPSGEPPAKRGTVKVSATLDGAPWSGSVNYAVNGPFSDTDNSLPWSFADVPAGTYTLTYNYGGPAGATLASITPAPTQDLPGGGTVNFILNFHKQFTSSIIINATLNGSPWSGAVNYSLSGVSNMPGNAVPRAISNLPAGAYTLMYSSGGPAGAILSSITPSTIQTLYSGGNIVFNINFSTQQATGNVVVNATLNGSPWSGPATYMLTGPFQTTDNAVPRTYATIPSGSYTITYASGGPPGAALTGITPSPSQALAGGRTIVFNLNFVAQQPSTGTISINALLDGQPWRVAVGSGSINYAITGPRSQSGNTVPTSLGDMPTGPYTLTYNGGGPIGATLTNISPAPMQNLSPNGNITFVLNFTGQPKGNISVQATVNGQPWSGQVGYVVQGPYVESGNSAPWSFSGAPSGSYSVQYRSGGPPGSTFEGVSPPSQVLPPGGTAGFNLMFKFQGIKPEPPGPIPAPIPAPTPGPLPGPIPGPLK
jgi:hypothetical protein